MINSFFVNYNSRIIQQYCRLKSAEKWKHSAWLEKPTLILKKRVYALCELHACKTLPQYIAEFMGSNPVQACIFLSFFIFVLVFLFFVFPFFCCCCLFVCFVSFVLFFLFFSLTFLFLFQSFRCLGTGRGLVPMLSFPKNAGIVKLLMPSETGRRPRSSMLSGAGNA